TVTSDRNGRRPAVATASPARVTAQLARMRRARPSTGTNEAYGRGGPAAGSRQDRVRNVRPRINRVSTAASAWAGRRINDRMCARPRSNGRAAAAATPDRSAPVVIRWPSDEERRRELADLGIPRLLLVDSEATPPICADALEDWIRLPSDERDIDARMNGLRARASAWAPATRPQLDGNGRL